MTPTPGTADQRTASTTSRPTGPTTSVSGFCWPQLTLERERSGGAARRGLGRPWYRTQVGALSTASHFSPPEFEGRCGKRPYHYLAANCFANRIAANMLDGSALPWPA